LKFSPLVCLSVLSFACGDDSAGSTDPGSTTTAVTPPLTTSGDTTSDTPTTTVDGSSTDTTTGTPTGTAPASGTDAPGSTSDPATTATTTPDADTTTAASGVCGDGIVDAGEACDLGAENGPDAGCGAGCELLPSACGDQTVMAELVHRPLDIILTIDNSPSMGEEIAALQEAINPYFAQPLEDSGLDYRVILVSKYGTLVTESVCIEAPLGGIPEGGCNPPPFMTINNPGKFYHYSIEISFSDSWCKLLNTVNGAINDQFGFAVNGWREWLRPDAFKNFVELTDYRAFCPDFAANTAEVAPGVAAAFDAALLAIHPEHFGSTPETRNYRWHSILGLAANTPQDQPYAPGDPMVATNCPTGEDPGYGYQALSMLTGGLRFPLCDTAAYDTILQTLTASIIEGAKVACTFPVPEAPDDKSLDPDSLEVIFTPGGGMPEVFAQVDSEADCVASSFYLDNDTIVLCPAACDAIQGDEDAVLELAFSCEPLDH
jgi:hypothetical protein